MDTADDDKRLDPRSNIFVIATLYAPADRFPVRVRNMSRHGALVEASRAAADRYSRCGCAAAASAWTAK